MESENAHRIQLVVNCWFGLVAWDSNRDTPK